MTHHPPVLAEALLRVLLSPRDRDTVSGDLLEEEYRDSVRPSRGRLKADAWYVAQVAGYVWRAGRMVALALAGTWFLGAFLPRVAWVLAGARSPSEAFPIVLAAALAPPALVLLVAGARASWKAESAWTGMVLGFFISLLVTKALLAAYVAGVAVWQPQLLRIGLNWTSAWDFTRILLTTTAVGTALSAVGGLAGATARRVVAAPGVRR